MPAQPQVLEQMQWSRPSSRQGGWQEWSQKCLLHEAVYIILAEFCPSPHEIPIFFSQAQWCVLNNHSFHLLLPIMCQKLYKAVTGSGKLSFHISALQDYFRGVFVECLLCPRHYSGYWDWGIE